MKPGSQDDMESFFIQNPLILEITEICFTMMARERGTFLQMRNYMLWAEEKRETEGRSEEEGKDIIYTYVAPKPVDEKSHHVRPKFDACCPQNRQLADILCSRRLFYQHFQWDINISV